MEEWDRQPQKVHEKTDREHFPRCIAKSKEGHAEKRYPRRREDGTQDSTRGKEKTKVMEKE